MPISFARSYLINLLMHGFTAVPFMLHNPTPAQPSPIKLAIASPIVASQAYALVRHVFGDKNYIQNSILGLGYIAISEVAVYSLPFCMQSQGQKALTISLAVGLIVSPFIMAHINEYCSNTVMAIGKEKI